MSGKEPLWQCQGGPWHGSDTPRPGGKVICARGGQDEGDREEGKDIKFELRDDKEKKESFPVFAGGWLDETELDG